MQYNRRMEKYIIALDQGTTSSRAVLFDKDGDIVDISQQEITQIYPNAGWVEEDPLEIYQSQLNTLTNLIRSNNLDPEDISSIGITNQRETTILWDKQTGEPVYNAIVWQCKRSESFCNSLKGDGYSSMIHEKTGLLIDPYFSATKIKWILDNVKDVRDRAERGEILFGTVDTWLLWKLTGGKSHKTDITNASRTMLFNIKNFCWDSEILQLLNIPESMLPVVEENSTYFGTIPEEFFGKSIDITSMIGDQQSALFGQLCTEKGSIKNTYGTGCFTLMNTGETCVDSTNGLLTTIGWSIDQRVSYALEGSVFVGGAVIQWLRDEMGILKSAEESDSLSRSVENSNGVTFLSTFQGVGTPYWRSDITAEIVGLTRSTKKAHIVRAALESIVFRSMEVIDVMKSDAGVDIPSIKVDGGACKNNFLMEFQSDISNTEIIRPTNVESTALGAAYMAGLYTGFWNSIDELKSLKKLDKSFKPIMKATIRQEHINRWKSVMTRALGEK